MKRTMSEETAMFKLADYCARAEHCASELLAKLAQWGIPEQAQMRIMRELEKCQYFDDERYARAFVDDKVHYNKWGRRKVEQALWQKHISDDIRQRVLDEVSDKDYLGVLRPLLRQKRRTTKADSEYEMNQKLMRFALGRGFTFDLIRQCLDVEDTEDVEDWEQEEE